MIRLSDVNCVWRMESDLPQISLYLFQLFLSLSFAWLTTLNVRISLRCKCSVRLLNLFAIMLGICIVLLQNRPTRKQLSLEQTHFWHYTEGNGIKAMEHVTNKLPKPIQCQTEKRAFCLTKSWDISDADIRTISIIVCRLNCCWSFN